ncbi:unnamed protein product [Moneuplotes crassus]|uniref:Uncharacterized protein n=1 Tax=Euplotes crassus TaxID=5936 RepID=A0AAD2D766_EUPCR|nr:unnamed protein product [Moneuplotes crassus]
MNTLNSEGRSISGIPIPVSVSLSSTLNFLVNSDGIESSYWFCTCNIFTFCCLSASHSVLNFDGFGTDV